MKVELLPTQDCKAGYTTPPNYALPVLSPVSSSNVSYKLALYLARFDRSDEPFINPTKPAACQVVPHVKLLGKRKKLY